MKSMLRFIGLSTLFLTIPTLAKSGELYPARHYGKARRIELLFRQQYHQRVHALMNNDIRICGQC